MLTTQLERRLIRQLAGENYTSRPVKVVAGNSFPTIVGEGYYHTTLSGKTVVHHPNAYGYRTWYHHSTRRVEVGIEFLTKMLQIITAQMIIEVAKS